MGNNHDEEEEEEEEDEEEEEEDEEDEEEDDGEMGEEGEDSNEGSGDGNEAYEGDDTEVCLALTHNVLNVKTLTLYSSLPTQLTSSMPHYPLPTLYVRDLHSIGIFYGNVAFPACALAFSTVSFNRHCLAVCRNFLSV